MCHCKSLHNLTNFNNKEYLKRHNVFSYIIEQYSIDIGECCPLWDNKRPTQSPVFNSSSGQYVPVSFPYPSNISIINPKSVLLLNHQNKNAECLHSFSYYIKYRFLTFPNTIYFTVLSWTGNNLAFDACTRSIYSSGIQHHPTIISPDQALFSSEKCWDFSYFSTNIYVVGNHQKILPKAFWWVHTTYVLVEK